MRNASEDGAWDVEVMLVRWPRVVITMSRNNGEIFALESLFDHIRNRYSVINDLLHGVVPIVMGSVVTSPKHHVGIEVIRDKLHHVLDQFWDCVAGAFSPLTSSGLAGARHTHFSPTTKVAATLDEGTLEVFFVHMDIRDMNCFNYLSRICIRGNLSVEIVDEVVIF